MLRPIVPIIALVLCVVLLDGCWSATREVRLMPLEGERRWVMGREFMIKEEGNVVAAVGFDRSRDGNIVLNVEVTNVSASPVLVAPEQFYYLALADSVTGEGIVERGRVYAFDPETRLREIDSAIHTENSAYASEQNSRTVGTIANAVVDIIALGMDTTPEQDKARETRRGEEREKEEKIDREHRETITSLNGLRREWETVLRRTTLGSRESIRGSVVFPARNEAKRVRVVVPAGARGISFEFRQEEQ